MLLISNIVKRLKERIYWRRLYKKDIFKWRVEKARSWGVKIGNYCRLYTLDFSTEPYLIEIGNHVVIGTGTVFITHDGGTWVFIKEDSHDSDINVFGKIKIGNNCFIGINCILLPGTTVGDNCVIGTGSVVRGMIPANSVAFGNPAKVVMRISLYAKMVRHSKSSVEVNLWDKELKNKLVKEKFDVTD